MYGRRKVRPWKVQAAREMRRSLTPPERLLFERLCRNQLGVKFRSQALLFGYIVDFYCAPAWLAVEVDGRCHEQRRQRDADRDAHLARRGILTLRFPAKVVFEDLEQVLRVIRETLRTRPWIEPCLPEWKTRAWKAQKAYKENHPCLA